MQYYICFQNWTLSLNSTDCKPKSNSIVRGPIDWLADHSDQMCWYDAETIIGLFNLAHSVYYRVVRKVRTGHFFASSFVKF